MGLFGQDAYAEQAQNNLQSARDQFSNLTTPNLAWNTYKPGAIAPQMVTGQQVSDDPMVKSAQMAALAKMGDLSNTGLSGVDQQGYEQARELGNQMASSGSAAALQNAQARGIGGSGMEFANREMANQAGAQRSQQAGLQQSADSARQRALYNQAYANSLGGMQQQTTGLNAQNAGILNEFNRANTGAINNANQYNTAAQNQAQLVNQEGRNNVAQNNFNNQVTRAGGVAGAYGGMARGNAAQSAADQAQQNTYMQMGMSALGMFGGGGGNNKQQQNPDDGNY